MCPIKGDFQEFLVCRSFQECLVRVSYLVFRSVLFLEVSGGVHTCPTLQIYVSCIYMQEAYRGFNRAQFIEKLDCLVASSLDGKICK